MRRWLLIFALCLLPLAVHATTTCGYTPVGANSASQSNTMRAAAQCVAAQSFTVADCQIYQNAGSTGAIDCLVYDSTGGGGAPGNLICHGTIASSTASSFNTIAMSGCGTITAGTYWVTYNYNGGFTAYDNTGSSYFNSSVTQGTFPSTFPSPTLQAITASAFLDINLIPPPGHHQAVVAASSTLQPSQPLLALTPPMGYNSFRQCLTGCTETNLKAAADALVASGLRDLGYTIVDPDASWYAGSGRVGGTCSAIGVSPGGYPSGLLSLGNYIHADGEKFGMYLAYGGDCGSPSPTGLNSCEPGDAEQIASYGADFLKYDSCDTSLTISLWPSEYQKMQAALTTVGRPVIYEVSVDQTTYLGWQWGGAQGGNTILTGEDLGSDTWSIIQTQIGFQETLDSNGLKPGAYVHPGRWNFLDLLGCGNGTLTAGECDSNFYIWVAYASELTLSLDMTAITSPTVCAATAWCATVSNNEVIDANNDPAGISGQETSAVSCGSATCPVFVRKLSDTNGNAQYYVVLSNWSTSTQSITVTFSTDVGAAGPFYVRNLGSHTNLTPSTPASTNFTVTGITTHDAVALTLCSVQCAALTP